MATATPYQTLMESAASLTGTEAIGAGDDLDFETAVRFLDKNRAALESARSVLGPDCLVPLRYEASFWGEHGDDLAHVRNLCRVFQAEARLAARRSDFAATATIGLDLLELANAVRRGGLVTDLLVGIALSGSGIETLRKHRANFDRATQQLLIRELERLEVQREAFDTIVERDRNWEAAVGYEDEPCDFTSLEVPAECGLSEEEQAEMLQLLQQVADMPLPDRQNMQLDQDRHVLALMRLLVIDLALHDARELSGHFADKLDDLVPAVLHRLPIDPFTEQSFIYRRDGEVSFHLYSTGPKRHDGGGQAGPWHLVAAGCADLFLDGVE